MDLWCTCLDNHGLAAFFAPTNLQNLQISRLYPEVAPDHHKKNLNTITFGTAVTTEEAIAMKDSITVQSSHTVDDKVCLLLSLFSRPAELLHGATADKIIGQSETVPLPPPPRRDPQQDLPILPRPRSVGRPHRRSRTAATHPHQCADPLRGSSNLLWREPIPAEYSSSPSHVRAR